MALGSPRTGILARWRRMPDRNRTVHCGGGMKQATQNNAMHQSARWS
jgi:hypothetical protein